MTEQHNGKRKQVCLWQDQDAEFTVQNVRCIPITEQETIISWSNRGEAHISTSIQRDIGRLRKNRLFHVQQILHNEKEKVLQVSGTMSPGLITFRRKWRNKK